MQRIKTAEEVEKKQRLVKIVAGAVLIFLMVFSTAGFALNGIGGNNNDNAEEDGAYFNGQYWIYNLAGQQFYFNNRVEDVSEIEMNISSKINEFSQQILYIDSKNMEVGAQISDSLGRYASRIQEACQGDCDRDLPEKDCSENLISFKVAEERKIYQEEKCIFIEGDLLAVDAFLYRILGLN
tara:strand:+ start:36 stop:581 length:546 start_codon:yes stop_codon:yes gene_type:complete